MKAFLSTLGCLLFTLSISAQCESWLDSPKKEEAENAHVVYRQYVKSKDYDGAFEHWRTAYKLAPAADGRRDSHFKDGIEIYKHKFANAKTDAKKKEFSDKVMDLYTTAAECYQSKGITFKNCDDQDCIDKKKGLLMGRQAFDMYYTLQPPRAETYAVIRESVKLAGDESEYIILKPYADIIVYLFTNQKIEKEEARAAHKRLNEIAEYGISNNKLYGAYYEQAAASMNGSFASIESHIFDCEYFVEKLRPDYEDNPEDIDQVQEMIKVLKRQGCSESVPFLAQLEGQYAKYAEQYNAQRQAEFEQNNPAMMAKKNYDSGDFQGAIAKYKEAISGETDPARQGSYYFSIASIQGRKLNQYGEARRNAIKAAEMKTGWGQPYMLIGDLYAKTSSSCGKDAYTRGLAVIAALDKWYKAKSVDSGVEESANRNIAKFSQYLPPQDDAFMMGKKEGQSVNVGCWIGETVKLRFR